jgi:hypothetical protein
MRAISFILSAGSILLSGCSSRVPGLYALSADQVYERLNVAALPDFMQDRHCGIPVQIRKMSSAGRSVTWQIMSSGREMLNFSAELTPVAEQKTRVFIRVSLADDGNEAYNGHQSYARPALKQPIRPAIEEQVAALIERRKYDPERLPKSASDKVCEIQRAGLESGRVKFSVDDETGADKRFSRIIRKANEARAEAEVARAYADDGVIDEPSYEREPRYVFE